MEVAQKISITYTISSEDFFLYENVILLKSFQQKKSFRGSNFCTQKLEPRMDMRYFLSPTSWGIFLTLVFQKKKLAKVASNLLILLAA